MGNDEVFGGKKLSDIYEEIYKNSKNTRKQIQGMIQELKPLITSSEEDKIPIGQVVAVVPVIKEYLEMGVKNDEHLIKLASIIQKGEGNRDKPADLGSFGLEDIEALVKEQEALENRLKAE